MRIIRVVICFIALIALGVIALVIAHPYLLKMSARSQAENDYNRLVSEAKTEIFVSYPELIERIVMDKRFAATITTVHLVRPDGNSKDSGSLPGLPNFCNCPKTIVE